MVVEPFIERLPDKIPHESVQLVSFSDAIEQADIIVLLVDHKQFKTVDREKLQQKIVIDLNGCWR